MTRKQKRLAGIAVIGSVIAFAVGLAAIALQDELLFYYEPSDVVAGEKIKPGEKFRIGGRVMEDSVKRSGRDINFVVSDGANSVKVAYSGLLPDLFREGQGVIAEGKLDDEGRFIAQNILARHDENYIPKELEGIMKEKGVWKGDQAQ